MVRPSEKGIKPIEIPPFESNTAFNFVFLGLGGRIWMCGHEFIRFDAPLGTYRTHRTGKFIRKKILFPNEMIQHLNIFCNDDKHPVCANKFKV